jgi:TonB family protein
MTAMAQALRTALLDFVWQGVVVALLLWVTLYLLRNRPARARYAASCAALAFLMAMPVATGWLAYQRPATAADAPKAPAAGAITRGGATPGPRMAIGWIARLEPWALPLWSAGVLFFSLRLVWGCWRVSAMRRRGRPADADILAMVSGLGARMGLSRPVRVLTAALPDGPSVAGWLRPVLLLPPAALLGLTPEQLEAVLAHELAHICRYDHLVNAVQTLAETLLFYHPAVWWTSARIREERELCCDDLAVRVCGDGLCLARALTKLERLRVMAPAEALGSTGGPLMYRVQRLIGATHQGGTPSKVAGILAFSLGLACLALNVHWAQGQERPPQPSTKSFTFRMAPNGDAPGVTVDLGGAAVLHRTYVMYPESARDSGIQGTVAVQVTLDANGDVSDAFVLSGPMELRKAVMSSVFEWHFTREAAGSTRAVKVMFDKAVAYATPKEGGPVAGSRTELAAAANAEAASRQVQENPLASADALIEPDISVAEQRIREHLLKKSQLDDSDRASLREREAAKALTQDQAQKALAELQALATQETERQHKVLAEQEALERQEKERQFDATNAFMDNQVRKVEDQLEEERRALSSQAGNAALESQVQKLEEQLYDLRAKQQAAAQVAELHIVGRALTTIDVIGLSEEVKSELLSRLPLHVGDTLSAASMEAFGRAVRQFDEHLEWQVRAAADGGATIRIIVPGARK